MSEEERQNRIRVLMDELDALGVSSGDLLRRCFPTVVDDITVSPHFCFGSMVTVVLGPMPDADAEDLAFDLMPEPL